MTRAPVKENLTIGGPVGRLEAILELPRDVDGNRVAVLCHPHPLHQGTMLNKVVHTLARAMNDLGMPALRFNFRGVGQSEGSYSDGVGEMDDLQAVADQALQRFDGAELWLGGFSFGALVALRSAVALDPAQLITIAPAVDLIRNVNLPQPTVPWLIVQGDADEVVSCEDVLEWVNSIAPGPDVIVMPGVGHFFHGHLVHLRELIVARFEATGA